MEDIILYEEDNIEDELIEVDYVPDQKIVDCIWNLLNFGDNLLLEGEPGSGKSALAGAVSKIIRGKLIWVECQPALTFESLFFRDAGALRDFAIHRDGQLNLELNLEQNSEKYYSSLDYISPGPVIQAFLSPTPVVLLLDEFDKLLIETGSSLLRVLADKTTTLFGNLELRPKSPIFVIATSNGRIKFTKEMHDRFSYCQINMPTRQRELEILKKRFPLIKNETIFEDVLNVIHYLRKSQFQNPPSIRAAMSMMRRIVAVGESRLSERTLRLCKPFLARNENDVPRLDEIWRNLIQYLNNKHLEKASKRSEGSDNSENGFQYLPRLSSNNLAYESMSPQPPVSKF